MWRQIIINMVLIIIYGYYFGQHSIRRYAVKGVIIIEQEENNVLITPPGKLKLYHRLYSEIKHFN